jgi:hypothetical protein
MVNGERFLTTEENKRKKVNNCLRYVMLRYVVMLCYVITFIAFLKEARKCARLLGVLDLAVYFLLSLALVSLYLPLSSS